jgi:hypothetical protein
VEAGTSLCDDVDRSSGSSSPMSKKESLKVKHSVGSAMRGISKQNAIRRTRLKFIQIVTLQDKALATKRPEMRDRRLVSKAKLKGGQM